MDVIIEKRGVEGRNTFSQSTTPFACTLNILGEHLALDSGNSALVTGFSRNQVWGLKNTIFRGISEPQKLSSLKHDD